MLVKSSEIQIVYLHQYRAKQVISSCLYGWNPLGAIKDPLLSRLLCTTFPAGSLPRNSLFVLTFMLLHHMDTVHGQLLMHHSLAKSEKSTEKQNSAPFSTLVMRSPL
jgi:hypothetical protein